LPLRRYPRTRRSPVPEEEDTESSMADTAVEQSAQEVVRSKYPELDPEASAGAARRWNRLIRLAKITEEYRAAQTMGEKSPANAIAKARGVEPGTVRTWLYQARQEGFTVPHRVRANELGPTAEHVAMNVKRLRFAQHVTTEQLAERVTGLGRPMYGTTITKIEKLQRRVDVDDLVALAAALHVTPMQLLEQPTGCGTCQGTPPPGFACNDCGARSVRPEPPTET